MKQPYRVLDAKQTGNEACSLRDKLSARDRPGRAIEQIVNIYQMYVTGLAASARPVGNFLFQVRRALDKHGPLKPRQKR